MSISRILELAGLSRIDETRVDETEVAEETGGFGFLRSLNETTKEYVCGDGKGFDTKEEAIAHANKVHAKTGNIISVVKNPKASGKKKDLSESKPSDSETQEASKLESELNGLKKKKVKTAADEARMARLETLIAGLEKKTRDKNDLKESQGWEVLARHHGLYDQCIRIARIFNTTPKVVWEVFNHMHNYDPEHKFDAHIPHGIKGEAVAEYIHIHQLHRTGDEEEEDTSMGGFGGGEVSRFGGPTQAPIRGY